MIQTRTVQLRPLECVLGDPGGVPLHIGSSVAGTPHQRPLEMVRAALKSGIKFADMLQTPQMLMDRCAHSTGKLKGNANSTGGVVKGGVVDSVEVTCACYEGWHGAQCAESAAAISLKD